MAKDLEIYSGEITEDKLLFSGDPDSVTITLGYNNIAGDATTADSLKRGTLVYWDTWSQPGTAALIVPATGDLVDGSGTTSAGLRYGILAGDVEIAAAGTVEARVYVNGEYSADVVFAEMEAVDAAPTDAQKAIWMERLLIMGIVLRTPVA